MLPVNSRIGPRSKGGSGTKYKAHLFSSMLLILTIASVAYTLMLINEYEE